MVIVCVQNVRKAFFRGETAGFEIAVENRSGDTIRGAELTAVVDGLSDRTVSIGALGPSESACRRFEVDTRVLKSGEYVLHCSVRHGDGVLADASFGFHVARRWNPDRMRVWLWPHTKFGVHVRKLDDTARKQFAWYADIGVNSFQPYSDLDENAFEVLDYALVNGWEMGTRLWGAMKPPDQHDYGAEMKVLDEDLGPETQYEVAADQKRYDAFCPEVAARQDDRNRAIMAVARQFPHLKMSFYNSEVGDQMLGVETPRARQYYQGVLRTVPHEFVMPGVISDDDEKYARWVHNYKWGDGYAAASERAARMARRIVPDFMPFFDPHRAVACYDRFRGSAFISTWTYTNPDPKYTLYIETLIATARYSGQGVLHTVTLLNYPGTIFPQGKGWTVMGPDRLVEQSWINLSRRPDGLGLYLSSDCDQIDTEEQEGTDDWWSADQKEPYQRNPATFEAFKKFTTEVVRPYGPMIARLSRRRRKTAVLSSESSRVYSDSPALVGHYNNLQPYCFYTLLAMIHVPADVIFDETILRYGLDEYDVLVLPKCDTLLESVYDRIVEFERRGGVVVCDQYLRAPIPNVRRFEFDFEYRDRISANAIGEGQDYVRWDDQLDVKDSGMKPVRGVTAEEDQRTMERYAAELREGLDGKVAREVDCSSPTALLNVLEHGQARYLFVVNDKRTYGDRVGPYKAMLDEAVPQTVTITLNHWPHERLFVYDVLEKKQLAQEPSGDAVTFEVDLPAPGGKIIALLPRDVAEVEVRTSARISKRGVAEQIHIAVRDGDGLPAVGVQPVRVTIKDPEGSVSEFSDFHAAESGALAIDFIAAANDVAGRWTVEAQELVSGRRGASSFDLGS